MLFQPRFDAAEALRLLPRATVMMGCRPSTSGLLEQAGLTAEQCRHMRLFISGSAPLLSTPSSSSGSAPATPSSNATA